VQAIRRKQFADLLTWFATTRTDGLVYGPALAALTPNARRAFFEGTPEAFSIGTFEYLLDIAHTALDEDPPRARELTTFVLEYSDLLAGPAGTPVPLLLFRGRAWKEHANALKMKGDIKEALQAVERAIGYYAQNGACRAELANARMLQAALQQKLGDTPGALRVIRECAAEFQLEHDASRHVQARIFEGVILFTAGEVREAATLWEELLSDAARLQDPRELARLCNNLWIAAVKLNDPNLAGRYYARAAALADEVGMTSEKPRLRLGYARALAQQGNATAALREFESVRAEFLAYQMTLDAANTDLESIELLHGTGRRAEAQARALALVDTFQRIGIAAKAARALEFLHARASEQLAMEDVRRVRQYFAQLEQDPDQDFLPPHS